MTHVLNLRPHHFLCILTYAGRGYSENFTRNFDDLAASIARGGCIARITRGPDDICRPRLENGSGHETGGAPSRPHHCHDERIQARDDAALADLRRFLSRPALDYGDEIRLTPELISALRTGFQRNQIRTACLGCEWKEFCDTLSGENFIDCLIQMR